MPDDVPTQLRELADWVDQGWIPQDLERIRSDDISLEQATAPSSPRRTGRLLTFAACFAALLILGTVAARSRDGQEVSTSGSSGWMKTAELPYVDRQLSIQAPAIWTGSEVLLVGALIRVIDYQAQQDPSSGGLAVMETPAYNPTTNAWRSLPAPPVPIYGPVRAVWTGNEVLVVSNRQTGGTSSLAGPCQSVPDAGAPVVASLDPTTGAWRQRSAPPVSTGLVRAALWTGDSLLLVFSDTCAIAYDPASDQYGAPMAPSPEASGTVNLGTGDPARQVDSAVWTGTEIVESFVDTGMVAIDPATGASRNLPTSPLLPGEIVWTGTSIFGLHATSAEASSTDVLTNTRTVVAPPPLSPRTRGLAPPLWTGDEVLTWGGRAINSGDSGGGTWLGDGATFDPATQTWNYIPAAPETEALPSSFTWAGDRLFVWTGGNPREGGDGVIRGATWTP